MDKDDMVGLQGHGNTAPLVLPYLCSLDPRPPLRSDLGLRIWCTSGALVIETRMCKSFPKNTISGKPIRKQVGMEG